MAVNNVTVTGKTGPGLTETSKLYNNVTRVNIDLLKQVVQISYDYPNVKIEEFDLAQIATVTYTIASQIATIAFST